MPCEYLNSCSLIRQMGAVAPFTINIVKIKYCELNKEGCARYKLVQRFGAIELPGNLWPSEAVKSLEVLESKLNETQKKLYG